MVARVAIKIASYIKSTVVAPHLEQFHLSNWYHYFLRSKCLRPFKVQQDFFKLKIAWAYL